MDQERIEQILNENYPADQPEGMRERVLAEASRELRPARLGWQSNLKLAFVGSLALFILIANISDSTRRTRLNGSHGNPARTYAAAPEAANSLRTLTREALAWACDGTEMRKVKDRL